MSMITADVAAEHHADFRVYATRTLITLAPPWVAVGGGWVAGAAADLALSHSAALPWITPALALTGSGLTALTWKAAPSRATLTRWHSAATCAVGTVWTCACAITPPWSGGLATVGVLGGAAVALSWNIRRLLRGGSTEHDGSQRETLWDQVKLAGVQMRKALVEPNRVEAQLQLPPGDMTVSDVQSAAPLVDKALGLRPGSTRVSEDPEHAGRATMTIVPTDALIEPQPWAGPSAMGGSIAEPLVLGTYEDQQPLQLILPGDRDKQRVSVHVILQGQNGAGKTHGAKVGWTEIGTRRDVCLVVMDPVKGQQSLGLVNGLVHTVDTAAECSRVWSALPDLIAEQADRLGRAGFEEWEPAAWTEHGIPYLVFWLEEATKVLGDEKTTIEILRTARSAGISIVLSFQRASYRQINTDARAQLSTTWAFGVQDIEDAAFCLPDEAIEAGVRPDRWGNRKPGCCYLVWGGVDESRWSVGARTPTTSTPVLRAALESYAGRPGLPGYAAEILGLPIRPGGAAPTMGARPMRRDDADDLEAMSIPDDVDDPVDLPADPEPDLEGDADTELPTDDPDMPLPAGRPDRAEALRILTDVVMAMTGDFTVRDLPADLEERVVRARTWVCGELASMVRSGVLVECGTDGRATVYRLANR